MDVLEGRVGRVTTILIFNEQEEIFESNLHFETLRRKSPEKQRVYEGFTHVEKYNRKTL